MTQEVSENEDQQSHQPVNLQMSPLLRSFVSAGICLLFVVLVMNQEALLLSSIDSNGTLPNLFWRLIWPVAFLGVAVLLPVMPRAIFLGSAGIFLAGLTIVDGAYFRFFGSVPSLMNAGSLHQLWDVRDSVQQLMKPSDALYLLQFLVFFGTAYFIGRSMQNEEPPSIESVSARSSAHLWQRRVLVSALFFLSAYTLHLQAWLTPIHEPTHHIKETDWVLPADHWGSRFSRATYAATFGAFNYHVSDVFKFLTEPDAPKSLAPKEREVLNEIVAAKKALNDMDTPFFGIARDRRIVVIQLEAIQHWLLGLSIDGTEVMPNLNRLADSALSWNYVMDVTFIGRTADAEFAVMTGLLPDLRPRLMGLGVRTQSPNYLGHILQEKGYRTASYHGYKRSFWDRSYNHPVYGFQEMHFEEVYPPTESLGLGLPDGVVFDYFVEKLATEPDNRSFSMVITLSSHHPYVYVPKEYNKYFDRLAPNDGWGLAASYLRSARYADVALGKLLEDMEKKGLMEDTLFVIYGDHDMGSLGAQFQLPEVGYDLFTRMADRVPFIIAVPGEEEFIAQHGEQHTTATGGLHDVMPTILHLIGEETPRGVMGTNLLIPDEFREAVPLPIQFDGRTYAYRHHLAFENSRRIEPIDAGSIRLDAGPSFDRIFLDQVVSRLLSHNPDIIPETEPERLAAPAPRDGNAELARRSP